MKMKWMLIVIYICWFTAPCGNCEQRNKTEYNKMPKMFHYDQYDDCLYEDPSVEASYCLVRVVIKPNNGSEVWKLIEKYSSNWKLDLNHAALDRGVCISDIENEGAKLRDQHFNVSIVPKFDINFPYKIGHDAFRNTESYKANFSILVDKIINAELTEKYDLQAYTEIEYCERRGVNEFPIDSLDIFFVVIMTALCIVVIFSSWYDYWCKSSIGLEHYRVDLPNKLSMVLASFSFIRNWYRLTSHSRDPLCRDLRFIQSIRYNTFVLILIGHACILVQTRTGWFVEERFRQPEIMIIVNGFQIVTTFFAISALVFTIMYIQKAQNSNRKPGALGMILIVTFRYIRLTPVYALVLLFEATWFVRAQDGPFWRRAAETELTYCRRNWWINLLYLNNYLRLDQPCMQHSWYLACDFQLSIIGVILVTLMLRLPKLKVKLLVTAAVISFIIPSVVIYWNAFDGATIFSPEGRRFVFWYDVGYHKTYLPMHMNLNMYIYGVIVGVLYWKIKKANINLGSNRIFRVTWYLLFLVWPVLFLSGQHFYTHDYSKPSLWMAVYFTVARGLWAFLLAIGFFGFLYRVNKPLHRLLNIRLFEVLGRLTYGAYVGHFFIMKMMFYNIRHVEDLGVFDTSIRINATLYLSYILSLVLTLLVELPVSALQKQLIDHFIKPNKRQARGEEEGERNEAQNSTKIANKMEGYTNDAFKATFKEGNDMQEFNQQ
ncbi:nose resistant to fluoxetine protein 6-like [Wyeomyia smithii]|uniref:nose resistant to fluoxetine protein 6-like n=1 Tax=Wyeomyia smithii TaxID=174621 RepID=UPI002467E367|nr:nose resistant to fluoxetine protein 6-like [Wyeomyia smithii]